MSHAVLCIFAGLGLLAVSVACLWVLIYALDTEIGRMIFGLMLLFLGCYGIGNLVLK